MLFDTEKMKKKNETCNKLHYFIVVIKEHEKCHTELDQWSNQIAFLRWKLAAPPQRYLNRCMYLMCFMDTLDTCPFCQHRETLVHAYLKCARFPGVPSSTSSRLAELLLTPSFIMHFSSLAPPSRGTSWSTCS